MHTIIMKNTFKMDFLKDVHRASIGHKAIRLLNTLIVNSSICTEYGNSNTHSTQNHAHTFLHILSFSKKESQIPLKS